MILDGSGRVPMNRTIRNFRLPEIVYHAVVQNRFPSMDLVLLERSHMLSNSQSNSDDADNPERRDTGKSPTLFSRQLSREVVLIALVALCWPVVMLIYRTQVNAFDPLPLEALILSLFYVALLVGSVFAFGVACRLLGKASTEVTASDTTKNLLVLGVFAILLLHIGHFDLVFWQFYGSSVDEIDSILRFIKSLSDEIQTLLKVGGK